MKTLLKNSLLILGLLLAFAAPGRGEESHRGFFEADLTGGGKAVFFVQGNHALSVYVFDVATGKVSFAGGNINDDKTFSLTANDGSVISGSIKDDDSAAFDDDVVSATLAGQSVTATRTPTFGPSDDIPGRFTGTATSTSGSSYEVKLVIDSQSRIFFIAENSSSVLGGFGTVAIQTHTASKAQKGADDPAGDDRGNDDPPGDDKGGGNDDPPGHDAGDDHGQDADVVVNWDEDLFDDHPDANFSLTLLSGEAVTGSLTFGHGAQLGQFTLNGETFFFNAPQESPANHLANISTRGFVNTGQGQLIGGFIITGGPKMVLIRALGPSLASAGVSPALQNPVLSLMSGATELRSNDNWQEESNSTEISATSIPPQNPNEAAILVRLEPGAYTAVVSGANNTTGIALIEVYEINHD